MGYKSARNRVRPSEAHQQYNTSGCDKRLLPKSFHEVQLYFEKAALSQSVEVFTNRLSRQKLIL